MIRRLHPGRRFNSTFATLVLSAGLSAGLGVGHCAAADLAVPEWAFPINPPSDKATPSENSTLPQHIPHSKQTFTRPQLTNLFAAPDWFPQSHAPMPESVSHGRPPDVPACGYCHLPTGQGRPENASLAGLPASYIIQQVADFKSGARRSALRGPFLPTELMVHVAALATSDEVTTAAEYFSQQRLQRRVQIVESATVARSRIIGWVYAKIPGAGEEPLGPRLMEFAPDPTRHENRDDAMLYVAYVPTGSLARGQSIAATGSNGLTTPCTSCHGAGLKGVGLVPPIAGRSPSYLLRQLLAFRNGDRAGVAGQPMAAVVSKLEIGNMVDIAAYAASLPP